MNKQLVHRPGGFVLELTLLPGRQLPDGGPIELKHGMSASTPVLLAPHGFRLLHLLLVAHISDEDHEIPEHFRGYRATPVIARNYADQVDHLIPPIDETIIRYMKEIRTAVAEALDRLRTDFEIAEVGDLNPIQHTRGLGYRIGDFSLRFVDHTRGFAVTRSASMSSTP